MSDLSDSLTVANLSWAILANGSQLLIWFEQNEGMKDEWIPSPEFLVRNPRVVLWENAPVKLRVKNIQWSSNHHTVHISFPGFSELNSSRFFFPWKELGKGHGWLKYSGWTLGWVNIFIILDFSTFSYLGKLIFVLKSQNKQIFSNPCKIRKWKLKTVWDPVQKRVKIESSFFAERFIGASTTKNNIP